MLNQFNSYSRKLPKKIFVPKRYTETPSTASLEGIDEPSVKKYLVGTKKQTSIGKIVKEDTTLFTSSLENIIEPTDTKYVTNVKSSGVERTFVSTTNIINDFHQEILQFSARYIKKHIDWYDEEKNTITLINTLLDYGTEGITSENFEVIVNGLHLPQIYSVNQEGNNVVVQFNERLFSYDGLQTENVIIIGKLLDIALLTEENDIVITDENGEALIL